MKKRGVFNVNEERLKEFMANGTDAEGTPKTCLLYTSPRLFPLFWTTCLTIIWKCMKKNWMKWFA